MPRLFSDEWDSSIGNKKSPRQVGQIPVEGRGKGRAFALTIPVLILRCQCLQYVGAATTELLWKSLLL